MDGYDGKVMAPKFEAGSEFFLARLTPVLQCLVIHGSNNYRRRRSHNNFQRTSALQFNLALIIYRDPESGCKIPWLDQKQRRSGHGSNTDGISISIGPVIFCARPYPGPHCYSATTQSKKNLATSNEASFALEEDQVLDTRGTQEMVD